MPQLVININEYFYEYRKDLYFINFCSDEEKQKDFSLFLRNIDSDPEGKADIEAWITKNLPHTTIIPLLPSTYDSGVFQAPYNGTIALLWDEEDRKKFESIWEDGNGKSKDSRFQLYAYPLEQYKKQYNGEIPDPSTLMDDF